MIKRNDYLNGTATHQEYYGDLVREIEKDGSLPLPCSVEHIAAALKKDPHLNTIPLQAWDRLATLHCSRMIPALRARGDSYSLAIGVCILKEAARLRAYPAR